MLATLRYLFRRLLFIPLSLFVVTALLYGALMLAPPETRASLYLNAGGGKARNEEGDIDPSRLQAILVRRYGLDDPYPVQYGRWAWNLLQGNWGWSPSLKSDVLAALLERAPATAELALYSLLLFIPLGLASGVLAGAHANRAFDRAFRLSAFVATSIPPFVLALVLLGVFYAGLGWFAPERTGISESFIVASAGFHTYTGFLTIDGLLNGRPDIAWDALRHLAMPVVTLSLVHWATLGRLTRVTMIEELQKDYVTAARGRGLTRSAVLWKHALRNAVLPGLNSTALSAASLVTGVFVVELIYNFPGVSEVLTRATWLSAGPDIATTVGFGVFSVLLVVPLMLVLDLIQALVDPRLREESAR